MNNKIITTFIKDALDHLVRHNKDEKNVTLGVNIEDCAGAKVTADNDGYLYLHKGESVRVNDNDGTINVGACETTISTIESQVGYRAFYPVSLLTDESADLTSDASVSVTLPATQIYKEFNGRQKIDMPMGAYTENGTTLHFKNFCSLVNVHVANKNARPLTMKSIWLKALDNTVKLCGKGVVTIDGNEQSLSLTTGSDNVQLIFLSPVEINPNDSMNFYIVVPSFNSTIIEITIRTSDGITDYILTDTMPRNTIATKTTILTDSMPIDLANGIFTVNANGKKVCFAHGNLQYKNGQWCFAKNQYNTNYVANGNYNADAVEHFFWGAINDGRDDTYTALRNSTGYDWGSNEDIRTLEGGDWHTLSKAEWGYIFKYNHHGRTTHINFLNASDQDVRFVHATVCGVHGIIIFPDYTTIAVEKPAAQKCNTFSKGSFDDVVIQDSDLWDIYETAGCVFLPAVGHRNSGSVSGVGGLGYYWTSTLNTINIAHAFYFYANNIDSHLDPQYESNRSIGFSVRLVQYLN